MVLKEYATRPRCLSTPAQAEHGSNSVSKRSEPQPDGKVRTAACPGDEGWQGACDTERRSREGVVVSVSLLIQEQESEDQSESEGEEDDNDDDSDVGDCRDGKNGASSGGGNNGGDGGSWVCRATEHR